MARSFSVYGDSISTLKGYTPDNWRIHYEGEVHVDGVSKPEDTWWGKVINHFNGKLVRNAAFSGAVVEGFGFPAGNSDERVKFILGPNGETPDVVLILMGINDYGWGGGRNQVMGESVSASAKPEDLEGPKEVSGTVGPDALKLFENAYVEMIEKIKKTAPGVDVWCVNLAPGTTPGCTLPAFTYRIRGIELDDYNAAIARAAQAAGAHLADIRSFGIDYDAVDGTHPSSIGMEQLACMVIAQMEGMSTNPADYPILASAPKSERDCYKNSCDGCEFADIKPNRWSLHCAKND